MCSRVTCPECGKPTFAGCGRHVEQVLADVPPEQRCQGHQQARKRSTSSSPSFWQRLFGGG